MSAPVIALFEEQTLPLANDIMRLKHLRHLPVVDEANRLVGIVSHRDILGAQLSTLSGLAGIELQDHVKVSEIMTRDVWTASVDMLASVAGTLLLDHRFGCLPIVDDNRVLVGILTERDFLEFAIRAIEQHD